MNAGLCLCEEAANKNCFIAAGTDEKTLTVYLCVGHECSAKRQTQYWNVCLDEKKNKQTVLLHVITIVQEVEPTNTVPCWLVDQSIAGTAQ